MSFFQKRFNRANKLLGSKVKPKFQSFRCSYGSRYSYEQKIVHFSIIFLTDLAKSGCANVRQTLGQTVVFTANCGLVHTRPSQPTKSVKKVMLKLALSAFFFCSEPRTWRTLGVSRIKYQARVY